MCFRLRGVMRLFWHRRPRPASNNRVLGARVEKRGGRTTPPRLDDRSGSRSLLAGGDEAAATGQRTAEDEEIALAAQLGCSLWRRQEKRHSASPDPIGLAGGNRTLEGRVSKKAPSRRDRRIARYKAETRKLRRRVINWLGTVKAWAPEERRSAKEARRNREAAAPVEPMSADDEAALAAQLGCSPQAMTKEERREADYRELVEENVRDATSEQHKKAYRLCALRNYDPIIPYYWRMDYPLLPPRIFTRDVESAAIRSFSGNDFRACHALSRLMGIGRNVRSMRDVDKSPAQYIKKEVERYIEWAARDGGYKTKSYVPIIVVEGPRADEVGMSDAELGPRMTKRLIRTWADLAVRYRNRYEFDEDRAHAGFSAGLTAIEKQDDAHYTPIRESGSAAVDDPPKGSRSSFSSSSSSSSISSSYDSDDSTSYNYEDDESSYSDDSRLFSSDLPPVEKKPLNGRRPTFFGIVCAYNAVVLCSWDSSIRNTPPLVISRTDYRDYGLDVWNALAIALIVGLCRDYIVGAVEAVEAP